MNRGEIIRMAQDAYSTATLDAFTPMTDKALERFAALVAAAEREKMQQDGWRQCAVGQRTTQFCGQLEQAVAAEREACAKVCLKIIEVTEQDLISEEGDVQKAMLRGVISGVDECAAAIRARSRD